MFETSCIALLMETVSPVMFWMVLFERKKEGKRVEREN